MAFEIASNQKYVAFQRGITSMVYNFFDSKAGYNNTDTGLGISDNQQLANELHKSITRKFQKTQRCYCFRDSS